MRPGTKNRGGANVVSKQTGPVKCSDLVRRVRGGPPSKQVKGPQRSRPIRLHQSTRLCPSLGLSIKLET